MNLFKIRQNIRRYTLDFLSINSKPKAGIHILNGHYLSLNDNLPKETFENLLKQLIKKGVRLGNFEELINRIVNNNIPKKECLVAFTFDDGFKECYTKIRPVLNKYKLKAAFFINPGFIDGNKKYKTNFKENIVLTNKEPMTWGEIKVLAKEGHTIGAHTIDHTNLNIEDETVLEYQLGECKKIIEGNLNMNCNHFAFPFGKLENFNNTALKTGKKYYDYIYSQSDYRNYYSFNGKVINRRHFECDWPYRHVLFFLKTKTY